MTTVLTVSVLITTFACGDDDCAKNCTGGVQDRPWRRND
jgi:hypothetical protein